MRLLRIVGLTSLLIFAPIAFGQLSGLDERRPLEDLPEDLREIRQMQRQAAQEANVRIREMERGDRWASNLLTVPPELQDVTVRIEEDFTRIISSLYKYYGFTGTESLRFDSKSSAMGTDVYQFREYIGRIPTLSTITIWVDGETNEVQRIAGWLDIDRGYRAQALSSQGAIDAVVDYIRGLEGSEALIWDIDNSHLSFTEEMYIPSGEDGALRPGWKVDFPVKDPRTIQDARATFYVRENGEVLSTYREFNSTSVRVCDGSSQLGSVFCGGLTEPIVIYSDGTCAIANCISPVDYESVRDHALDVEAMWEDILGANCCDVGLRNTSGGGNLDINVGDTMDPGVSSGAYRAQGTSRVLMVTQGLVTTGGSQLEKVMAHEMGHAAYDYATENFTLIPTIPNLTKARESLAAHEYVAEINTVLFQNYNGPGSNPKFATSANWETLAGYDISQQFHRSDMSSAPDMEYYNARVGLHAMYKLARTPGIGAEDAAWIIWRGLREITDVEGDGYIDWDDMREATIKAAELKSAAHVAAVQNAWFDVGVGTQGPPDPPPAGAPPPPTGVAAVVRPPACRATGNTEYDLSWSTSAPLSLIFWTENFITFNLGAVREYPTTSMIFHVGPGIYGTFVSACNGSGCSDLSGTSTPNLCF